MEKMLSDQDIRQIAPGVRIVAYDEFDRLSEILPRIGSRVALLYLTERPGASKTGHWVGLIRRADRIEFVDPYGFQPDHQFDYTDWKGEEGKLSHLLLETMDRGGAVEYNEKNHQLRKKGVNTCGRWVALRLRFWRVPLDQYQRAIARIPTTQRDQFVVEVTDQFLKG